MAQLTAPSLRGTKQSLHMQIKTGVIVGVKIPAAIAVMRTTYLAGIASYLAMTGGLLLGKSIASLILKA